MGEWDGDPKWGGKSVSQVIRCWFDPLMANTGSWGSRHQRVAMAHHTPELLGRWVPAGDRGGK